jgi:hypothetical protein
LQEPKFNNVFNPCVGFDHVFKVKKIFSSGPKIPLRGAWHPSLDFVSCLIETLGEGDDLKTSKVPILESLLLKFDMVEIFLKAFMSS